MYVKSPLNYTGGKYKLLADILPRFPKHCHRFVDLFAGGLNVGINVEANEIYANDRISYLVELYQYFQSQDTDKLLKDIQDIIRKYDLSKTSADGYNKLREDYNKNKDSLSLFVLTCYAFNHQIRFNNSLKFNSSFGKNRSSYNPSIEKNLINFCSALHNKNIILSNKDFREFDFSDFGAGDMVYCDPPYLISTGAYNDGKRGFGDWDGKDDEELFALLDDLDKRGVKFALSNVYYHKGEWNKRLVEWSKDYHKVSLDPYYSNCNYHLKKRSGTTIEVLVTNFKEE